MSERRIRGYRRGRAVDGGRVGTRGRYAQGNLPLLPGQPRVSPNADLGSRISTRARSPPGWRWRTRAIDAGRAAARAAEPMRRMPAHARQAVLNHCVRRFEERSEELAMALCIEAGKPIKDARGEVTRLIDTFRYAAEEAVRVNGEVLEMGISARADAYRGMWKRVPLGPVSFIAPFNFPLNLVAHKVAPAIAIGCPFVLKPASLTPVGALVIGEILAETDLPEGAFSILPCRRDGATLFTTDPRLKLLSFTGSQDVGWALKSRAGKKKVILELGGNAAVIVDEDTDLDDAVQRITIGAFYQSGQSLHRRPARHGARVDRVSIRGEARGGHSGAEERGPKRPQYLRRSDDLRARGQQASRGSTRPSPLEAPSSAVEGGRKPPRGDPVEERS